MPIAAEMGIITGGLGGGVGGCGEKSEKISHFLKKKMAIASALSP